VATEWYSTSATEAPSSQGESVYNYRFWIAASLPLLTSRGLDPYVVQGDAFSTYKMDTAYSKFLSDSVIQNTTMNSAPIQRNLVREGDYHTLAFLNDYTHFESDVHIIRIKYFISDGTTDSFFFSNNATNGGLQPNDASLEDNNRLLYLGVGPGNLEGASSLLVSTVFGGSTTAGLARPSLQGDWTHYTVNVYSATAQTKGEPIYFKKQSGNCKGYKVRRLAWRNSLGAYDYWNFNMKSTQTIDVSRNNYSTMLGTYDKSVFRYRNTQRGNTTRQTTAILKETLNTDWITQEDAVLIEKLFISSNIQIVENSDTEFTQGVILTDTSYIKRTNANDKLIQYTINIEYANPINTNS